MLQNILGLVKSLLRPSTYGSDLENYINSHHPTSGAQVEALERQYDSLMRSGNFYWGRGL